MGYVVLTTPTVREAVLQGIRYEALANDIGRTRLVETPRAGKCAGRRCTARCRATRTNCTWPRSVFAQWLLGDSVHARTVLFPHAAPPDVREHERVFGCPVVFGADRHAMQLDAALLARPSLQADAEMQAQMTRIADAQLRQHAAADAGSDEIARMRAFVRGALARASPPWRPPRPACGCRCARCSAGCRRAASATASWWTASAMPGRAVHGRSRHAAGAARDAARLLRTERVHPRIQTLDAADADGMAPASRSRRARLKAGRH